MRTKISVSNQVQHWLQSLSPDAKTRVRGALRSLANSAPTDSKALEGELIGFYRLRIGGYRIIYTHRAGPAIFLEYADLREFVYERFQQLLKERSPD